MWYSSLQFSMHSPKQLLFRGQNSYGDNLDDREMNSVVTPA